MQTSGLFILGFHILYSNMMDEWGHETQLKKMNHLKIVDVKEIK